MLAFRRAFLDWQRGGGHFLEPSLVFARNKLSTVWFFFVSFTTVLCGFLLYNPVTRFILYLHAPSARASALDEPLFVTAAE